MAQQFTRPPAVRRLSDREKDQLDADVATRLMGWQVDRRDGGWVLLAPGGQVAHRVAPGPAAEGDGSQGADGSPARPPAFLGHFGRYTREMSWAMTVVEAVTDAHRDRARESRDDVLFRLEWLPGRWRATFVLPEPTTVEAETDAVAICLAALAAAGRR